MDLKSILFTNAFLFLVFYSIAQDTASFSDPRDGIKYKTVTIGSQIWMAENLNYDMKFSFCMDCEIYGRMYMYDAAQKACPAGWHLPSIEEWTVLTDFAGGGSVVGGNLKVTGTTHWKNPNKGATNKSGFNAIPNGYMSLNGALNFERKMGFWWTSTQKLAKDAWSIRLDYDKSTVIQQVSDKFVGLSVRCIKD